MSSNVTFIHGGNSISNTSFVGRSIRDALNSEVVREMLNLSGNESFEVSYDGGDWTTEDSDYILEEGDRVRFTRATGTKGSL